MKEAIALSLILGGVGCLAFPLVFGLLHYFYKKLFNYYKKICYKRSSKKLNIVSQQTAIRNALYKLR